MDFVSYSLPEALAQDIAALFAHGWRVELERNWDGKPEITGHKDTMYVTYDYGKREGYGTASGSGQRHYIGDSENLREFAARGKQMDENW